MTIDEINEQQLQIRKMIDKVTEEHLDYKNNRLKEDERLLRKDYYEKLKNMFNENPGHYNIICEAIVAVLGNEYAINFIQGETTPGLVLSDYLQFDEMAWQAIKDIVDNRDEQRQRMIVRETINEEEDDETIK